MRTFSLKKGEKKTILIEESGEWLVELAGVGAQAQIVGAFVGRKADEFKIKTVQRHLAPLTKSNLLIKSVLFEESRLWFDGLIRIEKRAQKSDAYQRNENLLMAKKTNVETKPRLEIEANDVRCTHGVATGKIDEEQLFYLKTRGLSEKQAEKTIIEGFFEPVFAKIGDKKTAESLRRRLWQNLSR